MLVAPGTASLRLALSLKAPRWAARAFKNAGTRRRRRPPPSKTTKTLKEESTMLSDDSMLIAAEPIHQGEQQAGDDKREEDADTPTEFAVVDFGHVHKVLKQVNCRDGNDRGHQL